MVHVLTLVFFSDSGKVDFSDQLSSSLSGICICISNQESSSVGYMSWKRTLLFFPNSIRSLLLWQHLFKGRLLDFIDFIRNRKFQYSWRLCYILLCQGNQKINWKTKTINWTPSLYQQEKVKNSWSLKIIFIDRLWINLKTL